MINIAICDDDKSFGLQVKEQVLNFCNQYGLEANVDFFSDTTILNIIILENVNQYDIYILDIEMPIISGFELAKLIRLKSTDKNIIFLTSHKQYAIDAYDLDILRYIPKSECTKRLCSALTVSCINVNQINTYYPIKTSSGLRKLHFDSILYLEKYQKNCIIHTEDSQIPIKVRITLQEIITHLDENWFVFVNRGVIVNIKKIKEISKNDILLENYIKISIGKGFKEIIQEKINEYWCVRI